MTMKSFIKEGGNGNNVLLDDGSVKSLETLFKTAILNPGNLDANNLTSTSTVYTVNSDMSSWDSSYAFTNFPTSKPTGGFSLLCIKEGFWLRQIYGCYNDNHLYVRNRFYENGGAVWSEWSKIANITDTVDNSTKLNSHTEDAFFRNNLGTIDGSTISTSLPALRSGIFKIQNS